MIISVICVLFDCKQHIVVWKQAIVSNEAGRRIIYLGIADFSRAFPGFSVGFKCIFYNRIILSSLYCAFCGFPQGMGNDSLDSPPAVFARIIVGSFEGSDAHHAMELVAHCSEFFGNLLPKAIFGIGQNVIQGFAKLLIYPLFGLQFKHRRTEVITNEQRERILATYRPWIYGYKRIARELGLTRDQVRQVVVTTANQRRRKQMTSFEPNDYRVKKANSAYEDRDLSGYATDAEKIERLQDEIRLLRSLIVEYQKEFLPEALSEYPLFLSKDEVPLDTPSEDDGKDKDDGKEKKPRRSLKKKLRHRKEA